MRVLCLHTLRADCNAPLTPLRVALPCFASTRSVQIATFPFSPAVRCWFLCLHTLRADCNLRHFLHVAGVQALPPHAPCRLQPRGLSFRPRRLHSLPPHAPCRLQPSSTRRTCANTGLCLHTLRADCNRRDLPQDVCVHLCLHTLRADCNTSGRTSRRRTELCLHTLRADCNGRNAQNCNIHFFRTCVELVDSFSVLNKSMLR